MKTIKLSNGKPMSRNFTGIVEWPSGTKEWYLNGKFHRVDGPAVERANGTKEWHLNGKLHRVNGPAVEWSDGAKQWYMDGKLHRADGPAIENVNGAKDWYLDNLWFFTLKPLGEYIIIQEGLPSTMEWLGNPVSTLKVLTAEGIKFIPNLPGI
jgi:hypothetical protein